ncbi:MAG: aminotransferase class III-fold pyridoxal phosphate-dependent enzyme, partial [Alcanivoracaceae bacterium]|nr:aminotransferase class III-fold pyridoxal phosphate-dependent enzyme [Alcanivoracaceae bacterium]
MDTDVFDRIESEVQSYARSFPVLFAKAKGSYLYDENGDAYLDFLAGAGTLNYGHNNPVLKEKLIAYLTEDYIVHGLDMHTVAKRNFLTMFEDVILKPRDMQYIMQFTGP